MEKKNLLKKSNIAVVNLFRKNLFLSRTIRGISLQMGKPYPKVHASVKELEAAGVLKVKSVGKSSVCEISLSQEGMTLLSFLDEQEALFKKIPNMEKILGFREFLDDIILVAGSYAKGKETKKSDIDLVVITRDNVQNKQRLLETFTSLLAPPVHSVALSYSDFLGMLTNKEENYGKEIFRNRLIFRNAKRYYEIVKEAIENGFRG
jgi:predicted nucleotidyltransferase